MIRYFAIAAVIVLGSIVALLSIGRRPSPEITPMPYASTVANAGSPRPEGTSAATGRPVAGDAPWALSALPECFHQSREIRGPQAYVRASARDLAPQTWRRVRYARLETADCRLDVAGHAGVVTRGGDTRLAIPPDTRFYVWHDALVLDRLTPGLENIRIYTLRNGRTPVFTTLR